MTTEEIRAIVEEFADRHGQQAYRAHIRRWRRTSPTTFEVTILDAGREATDVMTFPEPVEKAELKRVIRGVNTAAKLDAYHRTLGPAMYGRDEDDS